MNLKHSVLMPTADGKSLQHCDPVNGKPIVGAPLVPQMTAQRQAAVVAQFRGRPASQSVNLEVRQSQLGDTEAGRAWVERVLDNMDRVQVTDSTAYRFQAGEP